MNPFCTYCGYDGDLVRDHVIPDSYLNIRRNYDPRQNWITPSCDTCNRLAGAKVFFSISSKAAYLVTRYKRRFRKALATAFWSESELNDLDYNLRTMIESSMVAKAIVGQRMRHLETVSFYPPDYMRPKWVEALIREYEDAERKKKRRKRAKGL